MRHPSNQQTSTSGSKPLATGALAFACLSVAFVAVGAQNTVIPPVKPPTLPAGGFKLPNPVPNQDPLLETKGNYFGLNIP